MNKRIEFFVENLQQPFMRTHGVSDQQGPMGPTEPQIGGLQDSLGSNIGGGQQFDGWQQFDGGQQFGGW